MNVRSVLIAVVAVVALAAPAAASAQSMTSPMSPLSPANPANPASPLNPIWQDDAARPSGDRSRPTGPAGAHDQGADFATDLPPAVLALLGLCVVLVIAMFALMIGQLLLADYRQPDEVCPPMDRELGRQRHGAQIRALELEIAALDAADGRRRIGGRQWDLRQEIRMLEEYGMTADELASERHQVKTARLRPLALINPVAQRRAHRRLHELSAIETRSQGLSWGWY